MLGGGFTPEVGRTLFLCRYFNSLCTEGSQVFNTRASPCFAAGELFNSGTDKSRARLNEQRPRRAALPCSIGLGHQSSCLTLCDPATTLTLGMRHLQAFAFCLTFGLIGAIPSGADVPGGTPLYQVFLVDGRALASYGEWVRVDGRIVFSMPLSSGDAGAPDLHLVSLSDRHVDWARTERYAESARAAHYAATRGEADFAALGATVARTLDEVAEQSDPRQRLEVAERARRALGDWPGAHFAYRAREVHEIVGLLDEIIAQMRASAGLGRFDLALSASAVPLAPEPLLAAPTQMETVGQLTAAWALAETAPERVSLLRTVLSLLDRAAGTLPGAWAAQVREATLRALSDEQRIERQYDRLTRTAIAAAERQAAHANVRALERLRTHVVERDRRLGVRRPEAVTALVATLNVYLESAHRLRLAQDQWKLRAGSYDSYERSVRSPLRAFDAASGSLERIRDMSGPEPKTLGRLRIQLHEASLRLAAVTPPLELRPAHALLQSAWELAGNAARLRLDAASSNSLDQARQASSAAAGSLMLVARAKEEVEKTTARPSLRQ